MGLTGALCTCIAVVWLDFLVGLLAEGVGVVFDSVACSWDPFSSVGLLDQS